MSKHHVPDHAVEAMLTPEERQALAAVGIATALIGGLIRAFVAALVANLGDLVGAPPAAQIPPGRSARSSAP
jgi:hypothetical protein